jgi:hypothetical protein
VFVLDAFIQKARPAHRWALQRLYELESRWRVPPIRRVWLVAFRHLVA